MLVSTSDQIAKAQTNNSRSKSQYSFPKAERFPNIRPHENQNICYNVPSALDKRSAGIGYGQKYDFTKEKVNTPDPTKYSTLINLDATRPRSSAYSFGVSRDQCKKRYVEGHFLADPAVPGPGSYTISSKIGAEGVKFSFRPKTSTLDSIFEAPKVPGPGTYKPDIERSPGKTILSTYRSSPITVFSSPAFARFLPNKDVGVPGPGSYYVNEDFLKAGQTLSQFKYQGARKFPVSARDTFYKKSVDTPGPGSYRMPSEFGYYENIKKKSFSVPKLNQEPKKKNS